MVCISHQPNLHDRCLLKADTVWFSSLKKQKNWYICTQERNRELEERTERYFISSALVIFQSVCQSVQSGMTCLCYKLATRRQLHLRDLYLEARISQGGSSYSLFLAQGCAYRHNLAHRFLSLLGCLVFSYANRRGLPFMYSEMLRPFPVWTWQRKLLSQFCTQFWS